MVNHFDTIFTPGLPLDRDKKAYSFIKNRLLQQEPCAVVTMYGNGKDYLFNNLVKEFEGLKLPYTLKILNTLSEDELRDFADMLLAEKEPTLCMVNLRIGKDVSWFVQILEDLRFKRKHDFVSFINSYVGDVYSALRNMERPLVDSLVVKERVSFADTRPVLADLSERFDFRPTEEQQKDIYQWSYGHIGLIRSLFMLKQQFPEKKFDTEMLLSEPTVLEKLTHIVGEIPEEKLSAILQKKLEPLDRVFFQKVGYINEKGDLFNPLLERLLSKEGKHVATAFSTTEMRVLEYFQKHPKVLVRREDVAKIVWGEEDWQEKFSDWAIGQLMYRLRKKLEYGASSGKIETEKGKGFLYTKNH
ncbi:MAG TPA: helix-turn-helix domain-containing protein [Candidatus Saccharimonadales bacterium]|nr:helix-turn-helix domain-containing protein [Candidatus Saccharimonadales bacterium]